MQCKSLWIKASAKCIHVHVNDILLQASWGLPKDDSHWLDTSYGHHGPVPSSSTGLRSGDWGGHSMTDMMPADCSFPNRICTAWKCAWGQAWKCAWSVIIVQNPTFLGRFQTFGGQCRSVRISQYKVHKFRTCILSSSDFAHKSGNSAKNSILETPLPLFGFI